jgi:hypothetical protein
MNEVPINTNTPIPVKPNIFTQIWAKIPQKVKDVILKFSESELYANKKIFWLVTGVFVLLVLTLIIGLIFGNKGTKNTPISKLPTPSPIVQSTPKVGDIDTLTGIENNLNTLNNQIDTLDVNQSRLKPPTLNFDVKF